MNKRIHRYTDQAATMNTNTRAHQIVYRQEVKPAITETAKPLVAYTETHRKGTEEQLNNSL